MRTDDVFEVLLDVNHFGDFKPEEITVKVLEKTWVEIHGRQKWRPHPGGHLRREFVQKLSIPTDYDTKRLTAHLTAGGKLTIRAPRLTMIDALKKAMHLGAEANPAMKISVPFGSSSSPSKMGAIGQPVSRSPKSVTLGSVTEITYVP